MQLNCKQLKNKTRLILKIIVSNKHKNLGIKMVWVKLEIDWTSSRLSQQLTSLCAWVCLCPVVANTISSPTFQSTCSSNVMVVEPAVAVEASLVHEWDTGWPVQKLKLTNCADCACLNLLVLKWAIIFANNSWFHSPSQTLS